jgi:hypothetical protein
METITFRNLNEYVSDYLVKFMKDKRFNHLKNNADIIVDIGSMDDDTYGRLAGIMITTLVKLEPGIDVFLNKKTTAFVKTHIIGHEKAMREKNCLWITPEDYAGLIIAIQLKDSKVVISPNIYLHRMTTDVKELIKKGKTYMKKLENAILSADVVAFETIDKELRTAMIPSFITMDLPEVTQQTVEVKPVNAPAHSVQHHSWAAVAKGSTVEEPVQIETEHIRADDETDKLFAELIAVQDKFNQKQLEQTKLLRDISALAAKMNELQMKLGLVPAPM